MEKLMYLVWLEADRTRDEVAERPAGPGARPSCWRSSHAA